ncbi:hypothetical protein J7E87_12535 [Streptomyces sp. ISL-1]|uniref:hypothetical protein n=1 Tax=Streptomyces sp. ISL-1 TaxID=2817657 RepID=UPI001BE84532|nr:hypothetical protein [Streptomyces sp. ISL-1]MBT2390234.1 hypothetical protein [Streptomyces sp. ISL-1]
MTSTADTTQHPDVSEISDLTEGLLSPSRTVEVQQHLDRCSLCADVRASLDEIRGLLGTLPGTHRMPADVAGRIDAALAAEALLDSTSPEQTADVSRETEPAAVPAAPSAQSTPADRPTGHARAATGPGRGRQARRRRKAVLGAALGAAAVGMSALLLQSFQSASNSSAQKDASVSSAAGDSHKFSASGLEDRVQALVATSPAQAEPRMEKGPSIEGHSNTNSPRRTPNVAVPPCIQKGTGRSDAPIAVEQGQYEGGNAYLVVLPHSADSDQVQAYVIDASCIATAPASTGKLLLTESYPRR